MVNFLQIRYVIVNTHSTTKRGSRCDASWAPSSFFSFLLIFISDCHGVCLNHHSGSQPLNTKSLLRKYMVSKNLTFGFRLSWRMLFALSLLLITLTSTLLLGLFSFFNFCFQTCLSKYFSPFYYFWITFTFTFTCSLLLVYLRWLS
jgi:hypothetical protein